MEIGYSLTVSIGRLAAVVAGLVLILGAVGCGDDEESAATTATTTTAERPQPPEPAERLSRQIPVFQRAVAEQSCDDALEVIHPVNFRVPDDPTSERNCSDALGPVRAEEGVEVTRSDEFGTGAIVDTRLEGNEEALLWALDATGSFKWTTAYIARPQVATEPTAGLDFERTATALVEALRDGDCQAAHATLLPTGRLAYEDEQEFCKVFKDNFQGPGDLGTRLRKDPAAEPVPLGETRDVAFYGLVTQPAGYRTLILGTPSPGEEPLVIDVVPTER